MDEQIGRNILENFEVSAVENSQHELKLNAPGVLKTIENGSLQFITVPTRDSEFIDHTLLNPEYITTHLANGGFIIDLMENQDANHDHNQTQFINDSIGNELQFQTNDDNDRRLTSTFFQLVKGNRAGNETQVIVTNKDGELDTQQLLTIDDTHSLLNEGQFKIFPSSSIALTGTNQVQLNNQPLPQLTPIRRMSRQRKNSINNSNNVGETLTIQNVKTNEELLDQNRYQRPLAKKLLPHKKRITKKLKAIDKIESQNNIQQSSLSQQQQQIFQQQQQQQQNDFFKSTEVHQDQSIDLNTSQFSCQICGLGFDTQLDFFSHLKEHYEPIKTDESETKFNVQEEIVHKSEPAFASVDLPQLQYHNLPNADEGISQQHHNESHNVHSSTQFHKFDNNHENNHIQSNEQAQIEQRQFHSKLDDLPTQVLNLENKLVDTSVPQTIMSGTSTTTHNQIPNLTTLTTTAQSPINKEMVIIQDELEFSDTEDMLEGIRGVVDKVQESVDDTGDEMDIINPAPLTWYSNSALNGEMSFKQPRAQSINSNADNYQLFFKNDFHQKENDNCSNGEENIVQHAMELQQHEQDTSNNLMHVVIVDQTQSGRLGDSEITNSENATITSLHILYQNEYNSTTNKGESSQISQNIISTLTKKQKKLKKSKKSNKQKKTKSQNEKYKNINDALNIVASSEQKRSRGRPSKANINLESIIENENGKISESGQQIPITSQESDTDNDDADYHLDTTKKNRKKYVCQKCYKVFNSINALKYHDFSHTGERPHQCDICGKSFFALNALRAHLRVHSGEKPFNCDECGRAFRQWGDLTYHKISLHSNEKNFQCEFCGKAFARKYSLVIHRRIHTQERNYKCEFCPKTFRASSYLQNHRKIHTGEKPYICSTCNKKFRVCGDLKRHQKIHEREKKLATHLEEIIKTDISPIKTEELTVPNKLTKNLTTYYSTKETTNLLKTDSNSGNNDNFPTNLIAPTTTTSTSIKLPKLDIIARTPKTNKKNRKNNSKKLK